MFTGTKEVKGRMHTYYQVLLDTRDMPHIVSHHDDDCVLPRTCEASRFDLKSIQFESDGLIRNF